MLENKVGATTAAELARLEERATKIRARELYDAHILASIPVGTFEGLAAIHRYLFQDVYDFAGTIRNVNLVKGNFRFAPVLYLKAALDAIDVMPEGSFDEIVEKYVEMNIAHPFREGNGRATRIWLDCMLRSRLGQVVDWRNVNKEDYLLAMERSPVRDVEIKTLLRATLTTATHDREVYMKGIDASYHYEGYSTYTTENLR